MTPCKTGIQGNLLNWITEWLTKRQQRVVLDNKVSDYLATS